LEEFSLKERTVGAALRGRPAFESIPLPPKTDSNRRAATEGRPYSTFQGTAAARPSPSPSPARTLQELQAKISEILAKPELSSALVGVKVVSLDTGRVLFEENAGKLLRPASNMKLYTVAAALDRLSPDYKFSTSVYATTRPDSAGVVRGDLTIYGRGDPSIAARFNNGDYFKGIDELATRVVAAGVKRVEGDIVGDESYFVGPKYGAGWNWEDLTWYYGAEITPLTVNDNALDLFIKPGAAVGQPAVITTGPPDPLLTITNKVTTSAKGVRREISIHRGLGENSITIKGTIPLEDKGYTGGIESRIQRCCLCIYFGIPLLKKAW
jgi:D-alanyl-D-alanine carboxypeptidase/D-alanyl-D-alanine-endopeptidase (penicillin-binding protein 4)